MNEAEAVVKRKKKLKTHKPKTKHGKLKQRQQQHNRKQYKIQLTKKFEDNEKEVRSLLENTSLLSESSNSSHRDEDNKSPSERFFIGLKNYQQQQDHHDSNAPEIHGEELLNVEKISRTSMDDLSTTTRSMQPTLASTFIQIEHNIVQNLLRVERAHCILRQEQTQQYLFKPKFRQETTTLPFTLDRKLDTNTTLMINRYVMEFRTRKEKVDMHILNTLKNKQKCSAFYTDNLLYKTLCEFKFKPIFIEPSQSSIDIPSKKLVTLYIKDLRFTEHPLLQEEHRVANNLQILCEHREQRFQEKITEKLYADLQIERNTLNELLKSAEFGCREEDLMHKEKGAVKIEHHLYKAKALREKLYDEELKNKQLLQEILSNWKKLKNLRSQQGQHFTTFKLRIKIEDLNAVESRRRKRLWTQRFDTDLNEIYREQLEEYFRSKRLRKLHKSAGEYISKPHKPDIEKLSLELKETYAKCFPNPTEPRIEVVRSVASDKEYKDLEGPRKMQSYFMRIFFDHHMVGETRVYRLERDMSVIVNENMGIVLNRSLPRDIRIKLYKKSKLSSSRKIANILVPLPFQNTMEMETHTIPVAFSSHKYPISGYLRINLKSDKEFYPNDIMRKLFPRPHDHTTIPKSLLREWYEQKLFRCSEINEASLLESNLNSDTEDDTEKCEVASAITCTFQEDLLHFCDPLELENNERLKILHSRYLGNDARTRDLKFIPMLDHELEFDWEMEETFLDTGNWMDPIDVHKHEGKKYLRNLYTAMENQCAQLTKMVESQENLLLNDEPLSWRAFFRTFKLLFQPRLNLHVDHNLSHSSAASNLTLDCVQNFKLICNIVRATGIPVRIASTPDTDSRGRSTPESSNAFILQNLKYSNVRPFIAVSYKDKFARTMAAEGSNPTWNEQLILPLSGDLTSLHDDLRVSLFDEVIENQFIDDPSIKNIDIYQRIQNNWLGEYRIPINAILAQKQIEGVFELDAPKILVGYRRPSLESISTNAETNVIIEQFPEIKESPMLWCYITLEPSFELPSINTKCLECSELIEVHQHLSNWSWQAMEMQPQRYLQPLICTAEGKRLCITRILQPLALPIEASENLLDSACRFVSMLSKPKFYNPCTRFTGVWLSNQLLLDTSWGSPKDLGVLLCNYLLNIGLQCSLVLGLASPYGECTFVLYTNEEGDMFFIDPCTGKRYSLKDVFCPLQIIKMIVTRNNFYLNMQIENRVSMMNFNLNDSSCWLAGFGKKNPAPIGGFQALDYIYRSSYNITELKYNIERKIMKKINAWRTLRKTIWNRAFPPRLLSILQNMEQHVTFGSVSSHEELKYNNMLSAEFPNSKIFGFTLNFSYNNLNEISDRIKSTGLHLNSDKNVEFSLAVHLNPYPNNILSVWLFLITVVPV